MVIVTIQALEGAGVQVFKVAARGLAMLGALALSSGCAVLQTLEPVLTPPSIYQVDATAKVEFVHPALTGLRCAARGARIFGLPGLNSVACADSTLITLPNPCVSADGGWYARMVCHEMAHINGWPPDHPNGVYDAKAAPPILPARFSPEAVAYEQAQNQALPSGQTAPVVAAAAVSESARPAATLNRVGASARVATLPAPSPQLKRARRGASSRFVGEAMFRSPSPAPMGAMSLQRFGAWRDRGPLASLSEQRAYRAIAPTAGGAMADSPP